jgi:hypothetical protein
MAEILLKVALNHNHSINLQSPNFATRMGTLGDKNNHWVTPGKIQTGFRVLVGLWWVLSIVVYQHSQ